MKNALLKKVINVHDCKDAMVRVEVDSQLIGSLAEVYYKEYLDQKGEMGFYLFGRSTYKN